MRYLLRLILSEPKLLFTSLAVLAVALAVIGFIWSERRARKLAQLSEDPELASGQRRRLAIVALVTAATIGLAAWWSFFRVHTEPQRFVIAIAVETADGEAQWWDDDPGATELAEVLAEQLGEHGLEPVSFDAEVATTLRESDDPLLAARKLEARWLIRGRVRTHKTIPLELAEYNDFILMVELELVDTETGEAFAVPDAPVRVFLWGDDPSDALALNGRYVAERLTMPLLATFAGREPLREFTGDRKQMTTEKAVLAAALERLFMRADSHARGLELRSKDEAQALAREPKNHAELPTTRISDILGEAYFIGTASDGRAVLLSEPKHISVVLNQPGYTITSEGEALLLASLDGSERSLLFEHYNFYSAPSISADGRVVWTTVANHGASKSLATIDVESGEFRSVLSHATDYYTSPIPAPDGSRALFFSRAGRYAETSIELIGRDGSGRTVLATPDEQPGVPDWAPDGRRFFMPIGAWQRIVAIDVDTQARQHLLGQDPDAPIEPEIEPEIDTEHVAPTTDPRHRPDFARHGSPAAPNQPDPATSSRFSAVSAAHDGRHLYVVEQSLDGREWLGRFDLEAQPAAPDSEDAPKPYTRLAQIEVGRLVASPAGPVVAFEAPAFTAPGDPENADQEVLVLGPEPGQLRALTLNAVDDELAGWSRDGRSVFTIQRDRDPGSERSPVTRVYGHDIN
ncbi:MAG TPA: hypothetical protein VM869_08175 [Enhygromyxa sp.]|nr:hypothetical protein [Enhygromyxa sp.]